METGGRTKGQKRLDHILDRIPIAREQLLAAIDDLAPSFDVSAIQAAAQSVDPRERNVETLLAELDAYKVKLADWLQQRGVLD